MEQYFTIDIRPLTNAECGAMTSGFERVVLSIARLLRLNPAGNTLLHYDASTYAAKTELDRVPASLREPAQALLVSLLPFQFLPVLVLRDPRRRCPIDAVEIMLVEPHVEVVCKVRVSRSAVNWPPRISESIHFMSLFEDGTLLVTGNDPGEITLRAESEFEAHRGLAAGPLRDRHLDRVEAMRARSRIVPVNAYDADEFYREVEGRSFAYWRDRGVYVPATQEQIDQAHANWEGVDPDAEHADVIAEIRRQQTEKGGGRSAALTLFFVTLVLFAVAGSAMWEPDTLAMLVGILLFHEAGHYAAMKVFRYRNVKMFFLPFFGAAVSGDAQRAVSWKRALVALAGPVPGIVAGAALGLWASWGGHETWQRFALLAVALNAANLLPVLPLDGGHVLHAVIFQRSRWADLVFRVFAGIGMILLGGVLRVIGILMLLQCRTIYKIGAAVKRLRATGRGRDPEGVPVMSPGATGEIAEELARELAATQRMRLKDFATHVKEAYGRLNVAPPGVLASLGILALYVTSLVMAVVLGLSILWVDWAKNPGKLASMQRLFKDREGEAWKPAAAFTLTEADRQQAADLQFPENLYADIRRFGEGGGIHTFPDPGAGGRAVLALRLQLPGEFVESALTQLRERLAGTGLMAFHFESNLGMKPDVMIVLPCRNTLDFVALAGTAGERQSNEQIRTQLAVWDRTYGIDIFGAGPDWIDARIRRPPSDWMPLAREAVALCPDLVEPGIVEVKDLADELRESGRLYLWWD